MTAIMITIPVKSAFVSLQLVALFILTVPSLNAQVMIMPLPTKGFENRIREAIDRQEVVDTHEHLMDFNTLVQERFRNGPPDFTLLLGHYPYDDLVSAGMEESSLKTIAKIELPVLEKWKAIASYWKAASNTANNRSVLIAARDLYGINKIDSSTIGQLSEKISKAYRQPEKWFFQVLKERCRIKYILLDSYWGWDNYTYGDPVMFKSVKRFDNFIVLDSKEGLENLAHWSGSGINTLDDLEQALKTAFRAAIDSGFVAVKHMLVHRDMFYQNASKVKAQEIFDKLKNSVHGLPVGDVKPLQDYMMHRMLDLAGMHGIPVQIHTGMGAGTGGNIIEHTKPTHMINLFQQHPDVTFILFHGAYPYGSEVASLAKNFQNVFIDMCWLYILSPSFSERYLHEWLEMVPANKLMAFGGDYQYVEGTYSHLVMAKQVVSKVLIDKVSAGYFSEEEAIKIAKMILHDNAIQVFDLK